MSSKHRTSRFHSQSSFPSHYNSLPPGSRAVKQTNHATISSCNLQSNDDDDDDDNSQVPGNARIHIDSLTPETHPKPTVADSTGLDKETVKAIDGSEHLVWYGIQGKTMDDENRTSIRSIGLPPSSMEIFVPCNSRLCQVILPDPPSSRSIGDSCSVGYLEMDKETHSELLKASETHPRFSCEIDLTRLNLGEQPKGTEYSAPERVTMMREFTFEPGHALVQPIHGKVNGFRSTLPGFSGMGFPDVDKQGKEDWFGEIEMLTKINC
ncbi:hypothetical protein L486_00107 [Kwoniella mangroviensis CBS 10435]|uniref:Uncharacterized protein n=1 Tax=Kwoniella mangroviensis CBS 10435 TaxID=1331196 RepID=A0A1B9IYI8_9TREE|nr:hypothetical protein L486_00107 [Kwoniella mangroviensis CBS 10435]